MSNDNCSAVGKKLGIEFFLRYVSTLKAPKGSAIPKDHFVKADKFILRGFIFIFLIVIYRNI
jgi:hypothetical protein